MTREPAPTNPGVRFPPPLLLAAALLIGWILETRARSVPLSPNAGTARALEVAGMFALAAGLGIAFWGLWTFFRARTAIMPHHAASRLVTSGPYRFTRNPMYVGLTTAYIGLSLMTNSIWPLVLLPLALLALYALVIRREERYLRAAFGDHYAAYQQRVRRWL